MRIHSIHVGLILLLIPCLVSSGCISSTNSRELAEQCGNYCFKVVKPLLDYASTVRPKEAELAELKAKIRVQDAIIEELRDNVKLKDQLVAQQVELTASCKRTINSLESALAKIESNPIGKGIELKSDIASQKCDQVEKKLVPILDNISRNILTDEKLEEKLTKRDRRQITSSCLGKLTEVSAIQVPGMDPFLVPCDSQLEGKGWTVIQRRQDASVDFNRSWEEYKTGFGDLHGNFFIGLEKLYMLTKSQRYELYVYLRDFENQTRYAHYSHFSIGSEADMYILNTLGSYSGNAGNSLYFHLNVKFSTPDSDNDYWNQGHCAKHYGSGWWFAKCYSCNLNGPYKFSNNKFDEAGIEWRDWQHKLLSFTQMMIRPIKE